jgi:hypothetical protein
LANQRIGFCGSLPAPICKMYGMAGKSPVAASDEQRADLLALADSRDRGEVDRARAVLLTLAGWTSSKIAEAFGVREDTVRLWRSDFTAGGVAALKTSIAPGPPPVKSEAALCALRGFLKLVPILTSSSSEHQPG